MPHYRKKPVVIEAVRLTDDNVDEVVRFVADGGGAVQTDPHRGGPASVLIDTLEGTMRADVGDWVIRGVQGEFYPCKPDIFEATYDLAD